MEGEEGKRDPSDQSGGRRLATPFHPVLVAAYPILFILARNLGEVDPTEALGPIAVSVGATLLVVGGLHLLRVPWRKAAILGSLGAIVVLLYGQYVAAIKPLGLSPGWTLLAWVGVAAIAGLAVLSTRRSLAGITTVLNVVAAVLVASELVTIGGGLARGAAAAPVALPSPAATATPSAPRPPVVAGARDIYYLVVEDYGSRRSLGQYLHIDDDGFFDWLADAGFTVLPDTRSNYGRTPLSMASALNMTYLDEVARSEGPDSDRYAPINAMVSRSAVASFLKERGYSVAQLGSQYYLTARSEIADVNPVFDRTSDFLSVLYESTIIPPLANRVGLGDAFTERRLNYEAATWSLGEFPRLRDLPGPKFVFYHLFLPHHPFVVDAEGRYVTARSDASRTAVEQYQTQWGFVDREMRSLIEGLLAGPEESRPIIILTTDEGPNPPNMPLIEGDIDWSKATDAQLDQKFSIFAAYYLPGVDASELYPGMSSVNSFRFVFDRYFDAGLGLLPDRSYIHQDKHHPYVLTDVTDRLPQPTR